MKAGSIKEKLQDFLMARKMAYVQLFNPESQSAIKVLEDLSKFCRANESCFHPDPRIHAVIEGRREVWLRLNDHINLSSEEFWKKYGRDDIT